MRCSLTSSISTHHTLRKLAKRKVIVLVTLQCMEIDLFVLWKHLLEGIRREFLEPLVSAARKRRVVGFLSDDAREMCLLSGCVQSRLIKSCLETEKPYVEQITMYTVAGKPFVHANSGWNFNCSRTEHAVAAASCSSGLVGIDVMPASFPVGASSDAEFFKLMEACFTHREWANIRAGCTPVVENPVDDPSTSALSPQMISFWWHWCLKEAVVKATGEGVGMDLRRIELRLRPAERAEPEAVAAPSKAGGAEPAGSRDVCEPDQHVSTDPCAGAAPPGISGDKESAASVADASGGVEFEAGASTCPGDGSASADGTKESDSKSKGPVAR